MRGVFNDGDYEGRAVSVPCNALDHFLVCHAEFSGVFALEEGGQDTVHAMGVDDGT